MRTTVMDLGGGRVDSDEREVRGRRGRKRWDVGRRTIADGVLYVFCWRMQQRRGVGV
jgi:hypothetical protein